MKSLSAIKGQDVAVVVKLLCLADQPWRQVDLAMALELSQGEIAKSLQRLSQVGLIFNHQPNQKACEEFLISAVKYMFPVQLGALTIGKRTGVSTSYFQKHLLQSQENMYVWPDLDGDTRGQMVYPLYPGLSKAASKDERFYHMMSAVEVLRMGKVRDKEIARILLKEEIGKKK
jgi:hypothetical protein